MKLMEKILSSTWIGTTLAVSLAFVGAAFGQDPTKTSSPMGSSSSSSISERDYTVHQRFWVGVAGFSTPLKNYSVGSYTDPAQNYFTSTTSGGLVGGGINFNLRLTQSFWINFGGVYRFSGYDTTELVNDSAFTVYGQRTRSKLIDFPLYVRYAGPKWRWSKFSFYELGGALRYSLSPEQAYAANNVNGGFCCAPLSTDSFKRLVPGVSIGTGLVAKDDFGIKVAPEVRYTRWLGDTFHSSTVGTMRDQLEVGISFGF
jgi:hypothetical protein